MNKYLAQSIITLSLSSCVTYNDDFIYTICEQFEEYKEGVKATKEYLKERKP